MHLIKYDGGYFKNGEIFFFKISNITGLNQRLTLNCNSVILFKLKWLQNKNGFYNWSDRRQMAAINVKSKKYSFSSLNDSIINIFK